MRSSRKQFVAVAFDRLCRRRDRPFLFILPKNRIDAKFLLLVNQDNEIVRQQFAERFVAHGRVGRGPRSLQERQLETRFEDEGSHATNDKGNASMVRLFQIRNELLHRQASILDLRSQHVSLVIFPSMNRNAKRTPRLLQDMMASRNPIQHEARSLKSAHDGFSFDDGNFRHGR